MMMNRQMPETLLNERREYQASHNNGQTIKMPVLDSLTKYLQQECAEEPLAELQNTVFFKDCRPINEITPAG